MTECTCTDAKQILVCGLTTAANTCLSAEPDTGAPEPAHDRTEPPALNSDRLVNSLSAALGGATLTNEL